MTLSITRICALFALFIALSLQLSTVAPPQHNPLLLLPANLTRIHFIGDLHGDAHCTRQWIRRTGLIDLDRQPMRWTGTKSDGLVFLGDYVDKGAEARGVLELVRQVQEAFPSQVLAMMGNHDLFAMLDAVLTPTAARPMGAPVSQYSYAFTHPQEYLNAGWSPQREDDTQLLQPLLEALEHVYDRRAEGRVRMQSLFTDATQFASDPILADQAASRLTLWQEEYAEGLIATGLVDWISRLPVVAIVGDCLVVHGGVSEHSLRQIANGEGTVVEALHRSTNQALSRWFGRAEPITSAHNLSTDFNGHLVDFASDAVMYRGYFKSCLEVSAVIGMLKQVGVRRIVVGHTPGSQARQLCNGELVAADSSLGRHFRAYGNRYCGAVAGGQAGVCDRKLLNTECAGSIVKIERESGSGESGSGEWPDRVEAINIDGTVASQSPTLQQRYASIFVALAAVFVFFVVMSYSKR